MPAGKYDITIDQGSDFAMSVTVSDDGVARNLQQWNARASMRSTLDSSVAYDFDIDMTNSDDGVIAISLSHSASDDIPAGFYVYDLEIYQGQDESESAVTRLLQGRVTLKGEVTR